MMNESGRIRVLYVVDSLKVGGVQSFVKDLVHHFEESPFALSWAALHGEGADPSLLQLAQPPFIAASYRYSPNMLHRLRRIIRTGGYAIVHAHGVPSCLLCERFRRYLGIPRLVVHLHHIYRRQHGQSLQNLLEAVAYRRADLLLGCSQRVINSVPRTLPKEHVYCGSNTRHFAPPAAEAKNTVRRELGFQPSDVVLGFAGRLVAYKHPRLLLDALAQLHREFPDLKALIVGAGPEAAALQTFATAHGIVDRVVFAGRGSDMIRFLSAMDIFVMASDEKEGFGLVLVEAMAMALPCLVSNYTAATEIVTDGQDALQFGINDAGALAARIRELLRDQELCRRLGAAARRTACRRFEIRQSVERLTQIYTELIDQEGTV